MAIILWVVTIVIAGGLLLKNLDVFIGCAPHTKLRQRRKGDGRRDFFVIPAQAGIQGHSNEN